eukprot:7591796-Lingulodinium_polyedra.AAC.1
MATRLVAEASGIVAVPAYSYSKVCVASLGLRESECRETDVFTGCFAEARNTAEAAVVGEHA